MSWSTDRPFRLAVVIPDSIDSLNFADALEINTAIDTATSDGREVDILWRGNALRTALAHRIDGGRARPVNDYFSQPNQELKFINWCDAIAFPVVTEHTTDTFYFMTVYFTVLLRRQTHSCDAATLASIARRISRDLDPWADSSFSPEDN